MNLRRYVITISAAALFLASHASAQPDVCADLAGQFRRAMMDEQLADPGTRSRNRLEQTSAGLQVLSAQSRQSQALGLMRDHHCPMPTETDSGVYALDAQECLVLQMRRAPEVARECDQSTWRPRLSPSQSYERGLPLQTPLPPPYSMGGSSKR